MAKRKGRSNYGYDMVSISRRGLAIVLGMIILVLGAAATVFCWGARDSEGNWAANPTITEWFDICLFCPTFGWKELFPAESISFNFGFLEERDGQSVGPPAFYCNTAFLML